MDHDLSLIQMLAQILVFRTQVVDPDGGVGQNQRGAGRRRGMFFIPGMVPPRDANRRALSRSMRAFSASRIRAVFSSTPVNSWAIRTRSSSNATVVLIRVPGTDYSIE